MLTSPTNILNMFNLGQVPEFRTYVCVLAKYSRDVESHQRMKRASMEDIKITCYFREKPCSNAGAG